MAILKEEYLDFKGLKTFVNQVKTIFATKKDADTLTATSDPYILNVDYSALEFDTSTIIKADSGEDNSNSVKTSALLNNGVLNQFVLGRE